MNRIVNNLGVLEVLGIGLIKISFKARDSTTYESEVIYQIGIGTPMIQNILEIFKIEIIRKDSGNSIIPIDDLSVFVNFFRDKDKELEKLILIYLYPKESQLDYSQLYLHSKSIIKYCCQENSLEKIKIGIKNSIEIPSVDGIIGIFIIDTAGCPLFTKIMGKRTDIIDGEVQIGGFISALFSFSQFVIGKETGGKLKEINFGNQLFYTITKKNIIFAFLVEKLTPLIKRYMYLMADEFLEEYNQDLENFNGDVTRFYKFEHNINRYFSI
ncbi:MAG: hypothetical protein EU532_03400 [Promethearchaeota archaeon]|nr:MAG: hypothetical protein EU532_03400 [Candidatus Lokiarchaeota archaeon]